MMTIMIDHMLCNRDNTTGLNKVIENIVDINGVFDEKDNIWRPIKLKCE